MELIFALLGGLLIIVSVLMPKRRNWSRERRIIENEKRRVLGTEPCGHCGSRAGWRWTYERVDGLPDRRYRNNPVCCGACGKLKDAPAGTNSTGSSAQP